MALRSFAMCCALGLPPTCQHIAPRALVRLALVTSRNVHNVLSHSYEIFIMIL